MDAGRTARKYPSYTLAQLEKFVADGQGNDAMIAEITARKSGASKPLVIPQLAPKDFSVQTRIGRM